MIDSHLSDFKEVGADSQAIAGWSGPGPYRIANNYLEGAGENVMFGGADPSIKDLVPSDIEIVRNHIAKPLTWKIGDPSYAGTAWSVKNLLELKNARRVLIEGNLFERNWAARTDWIRDPVHRAEPGSGTAPWSAVQDVTFRHNVVRSSGSGINILGYDDSYPSQQTARVCDPQQPPRRYRRLSGAEMAGYSRSCRGTTDVVIEHNTGRQTGTVIMADGAPHQNFVFRYNIAPHDAYGVKGSWQQVVGSPTLAQYFPGAVFEGNVLAGQPDLCQRSILRTTTSPIPSRRWASRTWLEETIA